ncbi:hypothetical protein FRC04_007598 [Tulasnella sp. 424]|nr:hypothetical protein FRC04_007598 [Tulasnella sp. 424]
MNDIKLAATTTKKEEELEEDELELSSSEGTPSPVAQRHSPPLTSSPSVTSSPSPPPISTSPRLYPVSTSLSAPTSISSPNIKRSRPHRRLFAPNLGPGQHIFQLDLRPTSVSSNGSSSGGGAGGDIEPANSEMDDRRSQRTFTSITSFNPPSPLSACRCPNKSKKPMRHWRTACPYNPNPSTIDCDVCGRTFTRKQNMERHKKDFHSGSGKERKKPQAAAIAVPPVVEAGAVGKDVPMRAHPSLPIEKG